MIPTRASNLERERNGLIAKVERLKVVNAKLVEALQSVKGQFGVNAHRYGCECGGVNPPNDACFQTRDKVLAALKAAKEEM